jgi:hypothetical protein
MYRALFQPAMPKKTASMRDEAQSMLCFLSDPVPRMGRRDISTNMTFDCITMPPNAELHIVYNDYSALKFSDYHAEDFIKRGYAHKPEDDRQVQ